jgi:KipI family sensor histidine kinase inhibitor
MQIAAAGDRALLVTLPGVSSARLRAAADRARAVAGVVAAIVGHQSLYVIGTADRAAISRAVDEAAIRAEPVAQHRIEVSFHEEHALDLPDFLAHAHLSREEFLRRLPNLQLSVRYLGFRAGFSYLDGWPVEWSKPRRATSRNHVTGGSFGIAGSMAGFYAVDSPGGWNILGRTAARLWDPLREPPNLFAPGDEIEIRPTGGRIAVASEAPPFQPEGEPVGEVIAPGQLTTIVGRSDWSRLEHGLPAGGAFDEEAAATANAAVGNDPGAPLLECVLVGPKLRFRDVRRVALCDGELHTRIFRDEEIDIGRIHGMRAYLAIEGGIDEMRLRYAEAPTVLKKGDSLRSAVPWHRLGSTSTRAAASRRTPKAIRVVRGPHDAPPLPGEWEVTPQLNRVGVRLRPLQTISFTPPTDLPSCGAQFGTLQWHADGSVVALGPDHPVTGGYLQPATIISSERWKLAQLAPGERVRLEC